MSGAINSDLYYRVSDLPNARPLEGTELIEIVQGGKNVKLPVEQVGSSSGAASKVLRVNMSTDDLIFAQAVYCDHDNAVARANANEANKSVVAGLVSDPLITSNGGQGRIQTAGVLVGTFDQWQTVTGMVGGLMPGKAYYLDKVAGHITPFAPGLPGQFLTEIGTAISPTELSIAIERPITL